MLKLKKGLRIENLGVSLKKAMAIAAGLGVSGIEINARTEVRPAEMTRTGIRHFRKLLQDHNLTVCSVFFPTRRGYGDPDELELRLEATKAAMKMAFQLGCGHVSNFAGEIPGEDSTNNVFHEALTDLGMFGQRVGARLALRTGAATAENLRRILADLPDASVVIDFDPGELIIHQHSPSDTLRAISQHVVHLRGRDAVRDLSAGQGIPVQLGRGSVDWGELFAILEEQKYDGFVTLDQQREQDIILESQQSLEYLDNLFRY